MGRKLDNLTIVSLRDRVTWVSGDVVYAWEDALAASIVNAHVTTLGTGRHLVDRIAATRRLGRIYLPQAVGHAMRRSVQVVCGGDMLLTCIDIAQARFLGFLRSRGRLVLHLVDCWERDVDAAAALASSVDLLLLASQDSVELVRSRLPARLAAHTHVFPVYVDEARYPAIPASKTLDIVQVGRKNEDLHRWARRYSLETGATYLYQRKSRHGIYYYAERAWEGRNYQLSYPSLVRMLSSARLALVSPPDSTDACRCGAVSPLTPRYLEAAMSYAVPVGIAPRSAEYASGFPEGFVQEVESYASFATVCQRMLLRSAEKEDLLRRNRRFVVERHSARTRARQLEGLLEGADA